MFTKYRERKRFQYILFIVVTGIIFFFFTMTQLAKKTMREQAYLQKNPRLHCSIPFKVREHAQEKIAVIIDTWGSKCDVLRFFVDRGDKKFFEEKYQKYLVELDMVRHSGDGTGVDGQKSKHIWERTWRMHVWVYENALNEAEFFTKLDCDTYVLVDNIKNYLKNYSANDPLYLGHKLNHQTPSIISGPFTVFSRETIRRVGPVLKAMPHEYGDRSKFQHGRCVDRDGATEERTLSICLQSIGITATDTSNENGQIRSLVWRPSAHLGKKRSIGTKSWFWAGKPATAKDGKDCCAVDVHSLHPYKRPDQMRKLHNKLYGNGIFGESIEDIYLKSIKDYLNQRSQK